MFFMSALLFNFYNELTTDVYCLNDPHNAPIR